jgi:hypothetical protein
MYVKDDSAASRCCDQQGGTDRGRVVTQAWHREAADAPIRMNTTKEIYDLLKARFPEKSDSSVRVAAQRFDSHLYGSAASLEAYACRTTLRRRLFAYALSTRSGDACCAACGGRTVPSAPPPRHPSAGARVCAAGAGCCGAGRDPSELLREQQGRILLMRQLSRYTGRGEGAAEGGASCAATCCGRVEEKARHLSECRDPACAVPGCLPTRNVVRHYTACLHVQCPLCGPVRAAIRAELADNRSVNSAGGSVAGGALSAPAQGAGDYPASDSHAGRNLLAVSGMPRRNSCHLLPSCAARGSRGSTGTKRQREEGPAAASPSQRCRADRGTEASALAHPSDWQTLSHLAERMMMKGYIWGEYS